MTSALIPAGGAGERMGAGEPKQFLLVRGKPLIIHTLLTLNAHEEINEIIIGCAEEHIPGLMEMCANWGINKLSAVVKGGASRMETVRACLGAITGDDAGIALIHDAARPLVSPAIISESIAVAKKHGAANTVIKTSDTVINSADGRFQGDTVDRGGLYRVQTPQTFKLGIIRAAHKFAFENGLPAATDDCSLVRMIGKPVYLTEGSIFNFKVTHREDLELFRLCSEGS